MSVKVAINGFGRIGRNVLRAFAERADKAELRARYGYDAGKPLVLSYNFV